MDPLHPAFIWRVLTSYFECAFRVSANSAGHRGSCVIVESDDWSRCNVHEVTDILGQIGYKAYVNERPKPRVLVTGIRDNV